MNPTNENTKKIIAKYGSVLQWCKKREFNRNTVFNLLYGRYTGKQKLRPETAKIVKHLEDEFDITIKKSA